MNCNKKTGICGTECKFCSKIFCFRCAHLETHKCEQISKSKEVHIAKLETTLAYTQSKKHDFDC